jgi:hypothetical protein
VSCRGNLAVNRLVMALCATIAVQCTASALRPIDRVNVRSHGACFPALLSAHHGGLPRLEYRRSGSSDGK